MGEPNETWGQWARQSVGILLLFVLVLVMLGVLVHMSHDGRDMQTLGWAREQASLVLGGFLGLVTGSRLAGRGGKPTDPPAA